MSTVLAIGGLALNVIGGVVQGYQEGRAAQDEAQDLRDQAFINQQEAAAEADRIDKKNKKFLQHQSLMFLKGGVTLADSPMFILQETREEAAKESEAIRKRGQALFTLGMSKADRVASAGRSAFLGSIFSGLGTAAMGTYEAKRLGVFG